MSSVFKISLLSIAYCLLSIVYSSCDINPTSDSGLPASNDSLPADLSAINLQIEKDRSNAQLYFQRAKIHFTHKNFTDAISDMRIAVKIDSTNTDYYVFLSDLYFTQNQIRNTKNALQKAIALDSVQSEALRKLSELYFLLKKYDSATFYINRCLHYDKLNAVAHFQKGMILKEWGDTAKAISSFQSAAELNQQYYDAYMQLGILYSEKKNSLALEYLNNALNINPKSIEALYAKGMFLHKTSDYKKALQEYETILQLAPSHQDAAFNKGVIFYEEKKYDEAIKVFETLMSGDENFYRAYYGRGRCYEVLGQKQKAVADYRRCLSIKPDYELAALQLNELERRKR